ncbi:MAG: YwmB family TATA-box binding protein [Moorellaceae bacterium]
MSHWRFSGLAKARFLVASLVIGLLILTLKALLPGVQDRLPQEEKGSRVPELLSQALEAAGARSESVRLESWGRVKKAFLPPEQVGEIAREVARTLGLDPGLPWQKEQSFNFQSYFWEGEVEPGTFVYLAVQSLRGPGEEGETYILTHWESRASEEEIITRLSRWEGLAAGVFHRYRTEPCLTYSLTAQIPGYLSREERRRRAEAVLAALEADQVEGLEDAEMVSLSAYTPLLPQYVEVTGREVNLNVALRYHSTDDITYLHIGSPLLGGEY